MRNRKRKRMQKRIAIIVGAVLVIVIIVVGIVIAGNLTKKKAEEQALVDQYLELAEEHAIQDDYDMAIAILQDVAELYDNEETTAAIEKYEMLKLKRDFEVYLISATNSDTDPESDEDMKFIWECGLANYTDKTVKKMEIILLIEDLSGTQLKKVKCKFDKNPIQPNGESIEKFSVKITEKDVQLQTPILEEMNVEYYIESVEYEDGTKVEFDVYKGNAKKATKVK